MSFELPLSEYELLRLRNIKECEELWQETLQAKAEFSQDWPKKQVKERRSKTENSVIQPLRRSSRLRGNQIKIKQIRILLLGLLYYDLK